MDGSSARPNRRGSLQSTAIAASALALPYESASVCIDASAPTRPVALAPVRPVSLNINSRPYASPLESRVTLLDVLREVLGLTGTKKGYDRG